MADFDIKGPIEVVVVGGGAAGFFMAAQLSHLRPEWRIVLLEKTPKLLSKVLVSGGGRCNVTHNCYDPKKLSEYYPRGGKQLRKIFGRFGVPETIAWFASRGVQLHTEDDGRMFPATNKSETIANCLKFAAINNGVRIFTQAGVDHITTVKNGYLLETNKGQLHTHRVFLATGGFSKAASYQWLADLGISIVPPVPSLFTFNLPGSDITALPGISVPKAIVRIAGTKLSYTGPLLITHWGLSGPAVLKLSAFGARNLHDMGYEYTVAVNWINQPDQELVKNQLLQEAIGNNRQLGNRNPWQLPQRLWQYLCEKSDLDATKPWAEVGSKQMNKLVTVLCNDTYQAHGKTTFKEEFVTCGGIALSEVDINTMELKKLPGIYAAGELLDIDGITGGFNFQAAWSTAWVAAQGMAGK